MIYCMQFDVLSSNNAQLSKKTTVTDRGGEVLYGSYVTWLARLIILG